MILYNSISHEGRRTLAYAHTLFENVKSWDYSLLPLTATMCEQLLNMLQVHPTTLLDKFHAYYQAHIQGNNCDNEGWLNILRQNTFLIKCPILVKGNKAVLCITPESIFTILKSAGEISSDNKRILEKPRLSD